jgi:hypothetical protein
MTKEEVLKLKQALMEFKHQLVKLRQQQRKVLANFISQLEQEKLAQLRQQLRK